MMIPRPKPKPTHWSRVKRRARRGRHGVIEIRAKLTNDLIGRIGIRFTGKGDEYTIETRDGIFAIYNEDASILQPPAD